MKTAITSCLAWLLVLGSTSFGAIVNGSFEDTPTFSGWETRGITSTEGTYLGNDPRDGSSQALLATGDGSDTASTGALVSILADVLRVTVADINAVAPNAYNGSAISQKITSVRAGDKLTFDWNFITSEGFPTSPPNTNAQDVAFFSVSRDGGTPQTFFLADPTDTTRLPSPSTLKQTGYGTASPSVPHTFAADGDYFVGFGVVNVSLTPGGTDRFGPSWLLIDNVTLTAVPEPTALTGLGLLGLTLTMRRRRR